MVTIPNNTVITPGAIVVKLPTPISANDYWGSRVVTTKTGKQIVSTYVTHEAREYKDVVAWLLKAAGVRAPLKGRVNVDLKLYPHRPLDYRTRMRKDPLYWADTVHRSDLDNARKVLYDAMKDVAFGDDKCIWKDSGEVMEPDGREACVVVTITPIILGLPQLSLDPAI